MASMRENPISTHKPKIVGYSNFTKQKNFNQDISISVKDEHIIWLIVIDGHGQHTKPIENKLIFTEWLKQLNWLSILRESPSNPIEFLNQLIISEYPPPLTSGIGASISITKITNLRMEFWWKGITQTRIYKNKKQLYQTPLHDYLNHRERDRLTKDNIHYQLKGEWIFKKISDDKLLLDETKYIIIGDEITNMTNCLGHNQVYGNHIGHHVVNLIPEKGATYKIVSGSPGLWKMVSDKKDDLVQLSNIDLEAIDHVERAFFDWKKKWFLVYAGENYGYDVVNHVDDISCAVCYLMF